MVTTVASVPGSVDQRDPISVRLHKNQLANRFVVDTLGYSLWSVIIARNRYDRLEKAGDWIAWIIAGFLLPYILQTVFNRRYAAYLQRKFDLPAPVKPPAWIQLRFSSGRTLELFPLADQIVSPLRLPFESVDKAGLQAHVSRWVAEEAKGNPEVLQTLKLSGLKTFRELTPKLANHILWGKLLILWANLFIMATKGQTYLWAKNWMTEKLSGKKGFAGEFNYASDEYLKKKSSGYEKNKKSRLILSVSLGFGSAFLLPLLVLGVLKSPVPAKGVLVRVVPWLKHRVKTLNYSDAIFMSKWVLLWINLFNWALPTLMSSRDGHEFRENLVKMIAFDTLFFLGDDIFAGLAARILTKKHQNELETAIVTYGKYLKLPRCVALDEVFRAVDGNADSLAYKLARKSFWIGLLGTALLLGITMPLLNFAYTRKKVLEEQQQIRPRQPEGRLQPHGKHYIPPFLRM